MGGVECGERGEKKRESAEEGDHPMASLFPVLVTSLFLILGTLTGSTSARERDMIGIGIRRGEDRIMSILIDKFIGDK